MRSGGSTAPRGCHTQRSITVIGRMAGVIGVSMPRSTERMGAHQQERRGAGERKREMLFSLLWRLVEAAGRQVVMNHLGTIFISGALEAPARAWALTTAAALKPSAT